MLFTIKKLKPQIVHFYLPHSYIIGGIASYFFNDIKFLMSRRSMNYYQRKFFFVNFFESKILHRKMKMIIANSKAAQKQLISEEGVKKSKIKVIYNFIDNYSVKKEKVDSVNILFIANLIPYKNHKLVIRAANLIPTKYNFKILIVGDGSISYKKQLYKLIDEYNLSQRFVFYGKLDDYSSIAKKTQIGILCSDEEGLSNSILEYMNLKLPVLATKVGGNPELITNNYNGFLVKKGDYRNFAKLLKKLISDKNLRDKFGKNSYKIIKQKFNFDKILADYKSLYENL